MKTRRLLGAALTGMSVVFVNMVAAQSPEPYRIYVAHTGNDSVGQRFALKLKERIAGSPLFELMEDCGTANICLSIVSIDESEERSGYSSAFSIVKFRRICFFPLERSPTKKGYVAAKEMDCDDQYVGSSVKAVGANKVDETVEDFLAGLLAKK